MNAKKATLGEGRLLVDEISDYLDNLTTGLDNEFPQEDFTELKLLGRLGVVARLYERLASEYLKPFSLVPVEQQVLVTLRSGIASEPAALAEATQQTRAGMTATLDRLEKRKLVKRVPHEKDRRKLQIKLTKTGLNLTDKSIVAQNQALSNFLSTDNEVELKQIEKSLNRMITLLSQ